MPPRSHARSESPFSASSSLSSHDSNDALLSFSESSNAVALRAMSSASPAAPQRAASYDEGEERRASLDSKGKGKGGRKGSDADVLVDRVRERREGALTAADLFDPSKTAKENKSLLLSAEVSAERE